MKKYTGGGKIAISENDKITSISESFKGESADEETFFPKGLGAKHPFDFLSVEKLAKRYGLINEIIGTFADMIITDFEIKLQNPNAQELMDQFIHDTTFHLVLREWVKEGLLKGNGFIEIDQEDFKVRVLNANYMYVKRNKYGKILEYNQWTQPFKQFNRTELNDTNNFKPNQIAHLLINKTPSDPYGYGIVFPNERVIENLIMDEQDLQLLISRKAGAPYHIAVGMPGSNTPQSVVDAVKANLQYMRNTVEWVTDGDTKITSIPFNDLGKSLTEAQMYFFRRLLSGMGMPEVLTGSGQLNEGIAKAQTDQLKRKINSWQTQIGNIIEEKIIRPLLRANNLDERSNFVWELPTEDDINNRILRIKELIQSPISATLKAALEIELAKLLGFEEVLDYLIDPKDAEEQAQLNRERQAEANIPQPEVPGVKPNAHASYTNDIEDSYQPEVVNKHSTHTHIKESEDMSIREWVNIQELAGFNYTDYLIKILDALKKDDFTALKAISEADIPKGLLSETEIDKLRLILKQGFQENQSVKEIEANINNKLHLRDRVLENGAVISSETRANTIARTETVRLANQGLLNLYNENHIEKVRFLAALSDRTCQQCEALNGTVHSINESYGVIPVHTSCRCSWISIIE